jgi:hypothetical protein
MNQVPENLTVFKRRETDANGDSYDKLITEVMKAVGDNRPLDEAQNSTPLPRSARVTRPAE